MTKVADIGSKRLISLDPEAWLQWITGLPAITARGFISLEFQWVSRELDQGLQQGQLEVVNRLLIRRFGELNDRLQICLQGLSIEQLAYGLL